ncbi:MAG TPA: hypothetical protein VIW28_03015 [Gemmatimonadales bacterium]|jgi:hypothetical protein
MPALKKISPTGIERALEKVDRYRLLNEPGDAESICLDILEVDPQNQRALVALLLSRTDQFQHGRGAVAGAREVLPQLASEYHRAYYAGIICERWARARHARGAPGAPATVYHWLREAMDWYEKAEALRPAGNDDPLLRWNACARHLERHPELKPETEDRAEAMLE